MGGSALSFNAPPGDLLKILDSGVERLQKIRMTIPTNYKAVVEIAEDVSAEVLEWLHKSDTEDPR